MRRRRSACMDRAEDYHRNVHRADAASTVIHHVAERARATGGLQRSGSLPRLRGCAHPNVRRAVVTTVKGMSSSARPRRQRHGKRRPLLPQTPSAVTRRQRLAARSQVWLLLPQLPWRAVQRPESDRSRSATRAEYAWRSRRASEWQRPSDRGCGAGVTSGERELKAGLPTAF
jgi:hypothetical protein